LTATRESFDRSDFKCYKYVQCYHTNLYNNHEKCCIYIWAEADFIIYSLTLVPYLNVVHCKLSNFCLFTKSTVMKGWNTQQLKVENPNCIINTITFRINLTMR